MTLLGSRGQRSRSQLAGQVKSCEHHTSWTTSAISMKLTENNCCTPLMTCLDFEGQGHSRHWGGEGKHVEARTLKSIFKVCSSPLWLLSVGQLGVIACHLSVFSTVTLPLLFDIAYSIVEFAMVMMLAHLWTSVCCCCFTIYLSCFITATASNSNVVDLSVCVCVGHFCELLHYTSTSGRASLKIARAGNRYAWIA